MATTITVILHNNNSNLALYIIIMANVIINYDIVFLILHEYMSDELRKEMRQSLKDHYVNYVD